MKKKIKELFLSLWDNTCAFCLVYYTRQWWCVWILFIHLFIKFVQNWVICSVTTVAPLSAFQWGLFVVKLNILLTADLVKYCPLCVWFGLQLWAGKKSKPCLRQFFDCWMYCEHSESIIEDSVAVVQHKVCFSSQTKTLTHIQTESFPHNANFTIFATWLPAFVLTVNFWRCFPYIF